MFHLAYSRYFQGAATLLFLSGMLAQSSAQSSGPPATPPQSPPDYQTAPAEKPAKTPKKGKTKTEVIPPGLVGAPDKKNQDLIVQIQCFLDQQKWGPGKIDGSLGEFTVKGVSSYNALQGYEKGDWTHVIENAQNEIAQPYTEYEVKKGDLKFVTPKFSTNPKIEATMKFLGYPSLLDFVAERYHTSEDFIVKLNPKVARNIQPGSRIKVPNVAPFVIEDVPEGKKFPADPTLSAHTVLVDTKSKIATFYEGEKLIASFPITPGQEKFIHRGTWKIMNMVTYPTFRWDKGMLEHGKATTDFYQLPPGPKSPVGIFWAGTNKTGIGMHGTVNPDTIGRAQSHGCVRLANWDAIRLSDLVRPGATLVIR